MRRSAWDGPTALGLLNQALDAGIVSTDKAADAINEFGIRAVDGSASSREAFAALGLNADEMAAKIAAGGPTAQQAFSQILGGLAGMTDPVKQETAGVGLFGSMWEDSGSKAILAMDPAATKTGELAGATEEMGNTLHDTAQNKVDTMRRKFEGWKQSMIDIDGPAGDIATWVQAFGPDASSLAATMAAVAIAFKGTVIAASAAVIAGRAVGFILSPIVAMLSAAVFFIAQLIAQWERFKGQWNALTSGNMVGATSLLTPQDRFSSSKVGLPSWLPGLATGGIVDRPTLAMIGEGNEPEAVIPLSKLAAMQGGGGGGDTYNVTVNGFVGNEIELARQMQEATAKARRMGVIPAGGF